MLREDEGHNLEGFGDLGVFDRWVELPGPKDVAPPCSLTRGVIQKRRACCSK